MQNGQSTLDRVKRNSLSVASIQQEHDNIRQSVRYRHSSRIGRVKKKLFNIIESYRNQAHFHQVNTANFSCMHAHTEVVGLAKSKNLCLQFAITFQSIRLLYCDDIHTQIEIEKFLNDVQFIWIFSTCRHAISTYVCFIM